MEVTTKSKPQIEMGVGVEWQNWSENSNVQSPKITVLMTTEILVDGALNLHRDVIRCDWRGHQCHIMKRFVITVAHNLQSFLGTMHVL